MEYLKDPQAIYDASFSAVRAEADLSCLPVSLENVAVRMIHACGMTDIVQDLRFDLNIAGAAAAALKSGAPVIADCEAVAAAITRGFLPGQNEIICTLNDARTPELAQSHATTRSAAAVQLWETEGAIIVIGNAPTALFALLEALDEGAGNPAAIIATPVGFVGAAESKQELASDSRRVPYLTLLGRRGGSAMAAAALNAIALGTNS
ncbi:MAG: precorrin-8X methylmutase [Alphaproteobacteria bacterium]